MPLQQVSVPYRVNVWIQWPEWYFAHRTVSKVLYCLLFNTCRDFSDACQLLSWQLLLHLFLWKRKKKKKSAYSFITFQVDTFVLVTKSHSSWQAFPNQTPNVLSLCCRVSRHMSTCPSGSDRSPTPCPLQWLWLPYLPTEDEGGRIKYPVVSCTWYCTRKMVKI